jgi:hypothetical protein
MVKTSHYCGLEVASRSVHEFEVWLFFINSPESGVLLRFLRLRVGTNPQLMAARSRKCRIQRRQTPRQIGSGLPPAPAQFRVCPQNGGPGAVSCRGTPMVRGLSLNGGSPVECPEMVRGLSLKSRKLFLGSVPQKLGGQRVVVRSDAN